MHTNDVRCNVIMVETTDERVVVDLLGSDRASGDPWMLTVAIDVPDGGERSRIDRTTRRWQAEGALVSVDVSEPGELVITAEDDVYDEGLRLTGLDSADGSGHE